MGIRLGSLSPELLALDPETREALLADYEATPHREHCSRQDYAAGWLAHAQRLRGPQWVSQVDVIEVAA